MLGPNLPSFTWGQKVGGGGQQRQRKAGGKKGREIYVFSIKSATCYIRLAAATQLCTSTNNESCDRALIKFFAYFLSQHWRMVFYFGMCFFFIFTLISTTLSKQRYFYCQVSVVTNKC